MVAKKRNFEMKTILMVMMVAIVVLAVVYVVLTPSEETEDVLSVRYLITNQVFYENKDVVVEGIYKIQGDLPTLNPPTTDSNPDSEEYIFLDLDTNNINLTDAVEDNKYKVRGKVEIVTPDGSASSIGYVQLVAESFVKV